MQFHKEDNFIEILLKAEDVEKLASGKWVACDQGVVYPVPGHKHLNKIMTNNGVGGKSINLGIPEEYCKPRRINELYNKPIPARDEIDIQEVLGFSGDPALLGGAYIILRNH